MIRNAPLAPTMCSHHILPWAHCSSGCTKTTFLDRFVQSMRPTTQESHYTQAKMHAQTHVHTHIPCKHTMYAHTIACKHARTHTRTQMCLHALPYAFMPTHDMRRTRVCTHVHTHRRTHGRTGACTDAHTHTRTNARMHGPVQPARSRL